MIELGKHTLRKIMPKKNEFQGASFDLQKWQKINSKLPPTLSKSKNANCGNLKKFAATFLAFSILGTFVFDRYKERQVEVEVTSQLTLAARFSNPCLSADYIDGVINLLKEKKWDKGNTAFIPDTPLYASNPADRNLFAFNRQLKDVKFVYSSNCDKIVQFVPELNKNSSPNSKAKTTVEQEEDLQDAAFEQIAEKNPELKKILTEADWNTTQDNAAESLLDQKTRKAAVPEDIHLMPYLRQFYLIQYGSMFLLFVLYFFDTIKILQALKLHQLILQILSKIAPWNIK
jgi:hypothetical protein